MESKKHSPEPWRYGQHHGSGWPTVEIDSQAGTRATLSNGYPEAHANATRIVACVNACAGMSDPEKAIREAREALEAIFKECCLVQRYWGDGANTKAANRAEEKGRAALQALGEGGGAA